MVVFALTGKLGWFQCFPKEAGRLEKQLMQLGSSKRARDSTLMDSNVIFLVFV